MAKKYYGWILFGVFIIIAGILLIINSSFLKNDELEISAPAGNLNPSLSEEKILPENETVPEIDMGNSDADFEADIEDFESDLESLDNFDEDIDLESIDDAELL
ncbi:hypothetical protein J7J13_01540 [bacterium]|nr:hypothetical protein [bacterium]